MGLQMGELVHDDVFDEFAWSVGEIRIVGDAAFPPMTGAPEGFHTTQLPGDIRLGKACGPDEMEFVEQDAQGGQFIRRRRRALRLRLRKDLGTRRNAPLPVRPQERLALGDRRPPFRHGEADTSLGIHAHVDAADPLACDDDGDPVHRIEPRAQHQS